MDNWAFDLWLCHRILFRLLYSLRAQSFRGGNGRIPGRNFSWPSYGSIDRDIGGRSARSARGPTQRDRAAAIPAVGPLCCHGCRRSPGSARGEIRLLYPGAMVGPGREDGRIYWGARGEWDICSRFPGARAPLRPSSRERNDPYDGLDRFDRVVDLLWRNYNTSTDAARIQHGYDRAGNRLWREGQKGTFYFNWGFRGHGGSGDTHR